MVHNHTEGVILNKKTKRWYDNNSPQPKKVNGQLTLRTAFYRRELTKICKSLFKIECPEEWDKDYILENIINRGYIIFTESKIGVIPLYGGLKGYNYLNFPTGAMMVAPVLNDSWEVTFGENAVLVYLEHDYNRWFYKLRDLVQITAEKLASCDGAIDVNIFNSKLAYVAEAETKAQAETIKTMFDQVSEGNPLVVYRKDALTNQRNGLQVFFNDIKRNFIAQELQDTKRTIINEFLTSIGINNANTDKKERLVTNEVDANNIELAANTDHWQENLEKKNREMKKVFPYINFSIKLRYAEINKKAITEAFKGGGDNDPTEHNTDMGTKPSE